MILCLVISVILGYLVGSISTSLIIGKVFFKIDIREYGSKNAGGTNAGRVLGKKAGFLVIMFDALKVGLSFGISTLLIYLFKLELTQEQTSIILYLGAIFTAIGHCYPIYFGFKGGKAVSTLLGFVVFTNPYLLITMFIIFGLILFFSKYVSLSSITSSILLVAFSFIPFYQNGMWITPYTIYYSLALLVFCVLLIFKHRSNIVRLVTKKELKARWIVRIHDKIKNSSK